MMIESTGFSRLWNSFCLCHHKLPRLQ